jgi:adenylate kinase family enzyme
VRIHILGASGSGTSTLGGRLAAELGCPLFDTDDFFWLSTDPPYQTPRRREERQLMLGEQLRDKPAWVLSGSLCGWGDIFIPLFDLVVFLLVPTAERVRRVRAREVERYGAEALEPGGARHGASSAFVAWVERYDIASVDERSRAMHEAWLARLPCQVLRFEGVAPVDAMVGEVRRALGERRRADD